MKLNHIRALPNVEFHEIEMKRLLCHKKPLEPLVRLINELNGNRLEVIQKALRQLNNLVDPNMLMDAGNRYMAGQSFYIPPMSIRMIDKDGQEVTFKLEYVKYIVTSRRKNIFEIRNSLIENDNSNLTESHRKKYGYADRIFFFIEKNLVSKEPELLYYMVDTLDKISENDKTNELVINTGTIKADFIANKINWSKSPYVERYLQEFDERGSI